ncbi:uncharacterized protein ColSpa_08427 [Colletotrichum spaethianum]|uniref:Hsp70-like protein n=1 Tax=Colletotrichum spaethianum TaxID=700344 RepID=A0AA37P9Q6_9PEZI|nr:uncharacterized protein ColSpa_08427 [Colletotrichum spaethianum]GKT48246.1 hypothetical protein ColSpa_08427 [Colletotrichum spaethianum]
MADAENAIVVGIDFGTIWEAKLNFASETEKAPTAILYRGAQGAVSWGHDVPVEETSDAMRWFKLLLIDEIDLPDNLRTSSKWLQLGSW